VPATEPADVIFLFDMATGYGSPLPQPAGRFDLLLNGRKELSFCVSKSSRLWQGVDGVSLYYQVKRQFTAQPGHSLTLDAQITQDGMASFGLGVLRVPRRLLQAGAPARLEVVPFNRSSSARWFRVGRIFDLANIDFWPGLAAVRAGRTPPRLGEYNIYFGDIHSHSAESIKLNDKGCGTGTRAENFAYARDISGLDIYALSEHDWQMNEEDWLSLQHDTDRYYEPGRFATLHSYEWTSQGYRHRNVYYLDAGHRFFNSSASGNANGIDVRNPSPRDLWAALEIVQSDNSGLNEEVMGLIRQVYGQEGSG
jgi:hypothetical protein